jgi:Protein of unknown function (DUF1236)
MRTKLFTATAAAALFAAGAALAQSGGSYQTGGQSDVQSSRHQNSAHANAAGTPDQQNQAGPQDQTNKGGMQNTSSGDQMNGGAMGNMRSDQNRMGTSERVRINENGNRTNIRLTTTQRTRIRDVVVRERGPRLTRVTFRVGVGARIPRTVRVAVLPPEIVTIAPQWAGYSYFVYGNEIVIVDPASFAIMATLPL